MRRTRQVQFRRRDAADWETTLIVDDFRWEDPDVVILDAKGDVVNKVRVGAMEAYIGWRGGDVWVLD